MKSVLLGLSVTALSLSSLAAGSPSGRNLLPEIRSVVARDIMTPGFDTRGAEQLPRFDGEDSSRWRPAGLRRAELDDKAQSRQRGHYPWISRNACGVGPAASS